MGLGMKRYSQLAYMIEHVERTQPTQPWKGIWQEPSCKKCCNRAKIILLFPGNVVQSLLGRDIEDTQNPRVGRQLNGAATHPVLKSRSRQCPRQKASRPSRKQSAFLPAWPLRSVASPSCYFCPLNGTLFPWNWSSLALIPFPGVNRTTFSLSLAGKIFKDSCTVWDELSTLLFHLNFSHLKAQPRQLPPLLWCFTSNANGTFYCVLIYLCLSFCHSSNPIS